MKTMYLSALLVTLLAVTGCQQRIGAPALKTPTVGFLLPDTYNSPDGMTPGPDGAIYLAMNNVSDPSHPAMIMRITAEDVLEEVYTLPPHPTTGVASPLGIAFGSDGHLYVADNQAFATEEPRQARLLRVNMDGGKATGCDVVATGFNMSNGVACYQDAVYVCETTIDKTYPLSSGIYRFELAELDPATPIEVTGLDDPHLEVTLKTVNEEHQVGANGVDIDDDGNLYVCNFGDAEVYKVTLDEKGLSTQQELLAKGKGIESTDGLHIGPEGDLWVADFLGNAVIRINPDSGKVTIVAKNDQTDGANGELDAPSECIRRGNRVYVSNIDLTYGPNETDDVHTISVIDLD